MALPIYVCLFFFFKQKTAYEIYQCDWSSDVCSSDLQALVQRADLLLLDEPITGLDLASQQRILAIVDEEKQTGSTVVLSTHHLDEARHADQILLLATRAIATGPPDEVLTEANLRAAYGNRVLSPRDGEELAVLDDHGHGH